MEQEYLIKETRDYCSNYNVGISPLMTGFDVLTNPSFMQQIGLALQKSVFAIEHGRLQLAYFKRKDIDKIGDLLLGKLCKNPSFILDKHKEARTKDADLFQFCRANFIAERLQSMNDKELAGVYETFMKKYAVMRAARNIYYHFLPEPLQRFLWELLNKKSSKVQADFMALTAPDEPSWSEEERIHFLKLAEIVQNTKSTKDATFLELLNEHVWLFQGLQYDYFGPVILDKEYFLQQLDEFLKKDVPASQERAKIEKKNKELQSRQKQLSERLLTPEEQLYFASMRKLILFKEHKKISQSMVHVPMQTVLMPEICRRIGITLKEARLLDVNEVLQSLQSKQVAHAEILRRSEHLSVIDDKNGRTILSGKDAEAYNLQFKETFETKEVFQGMSVSPGVWRGMVKIVNAQDELEKVKQGDIIVTLMTKPSFLSALKRAGAIVASTGGITSHASIIARELKKPCIVGVKGAAALLKDGDMVEVDADKGAVRILNKGL